MKPILGCFFLAASLLSATLAHSQWSYTDLNPPGSIWSEVWGVSGTGQVGLSFQGYLCCFAARWQGSPGSVSLHDAYAFFATDGTWDAGAFGADVRAVAAYGPYMYALNQPPTATRAIARATSNGMFGGEVTMDGAVKATLWKSTRERALATILHPPGSGSSAVHAMYSNMQAGVVDGRAATWLGTASSYVDRHPPGYFQSAIYGLQQSTAVGSAVYWGYGPGLYAALWDLAGGRFSVLHPYGYAASLLTGVSLDSASGWVEDSAGIRHAGVWNLGTRRFTDLHVYLPAAYGESEATSVWKAANGATYVGGIALVNGNPHGMLWYLPPPQP